MLAAIPTVILEEHHEAYLVIANALKQGKLQMTEHQLLHVDEHHDLACPVVDSRSFSLENDLRTIAALTYGQLRVSDFIIPLAYQGLIREVHWLRRGHQAGTELNLDVQTVDYGSKVIFRSRATRSEGMLRLSRTRVDSAFRPNRPVLLSIDLDYFSSNDNRAEYTEIEISADAYRSFLGEKLHPWRCKFGARVNVIDRHGRYYLTHQAYDGPLEDRWSPDGKISEQVDQLGKFLTRSGVNPQFVLICRSRQTGYTPEDQVQLIEDRVLDMLTSIYNLDVRYIAEELGWLGVDSPPIDQQDSL